MQFLFLNQFAPPDPAPTARLLEDLAAHLEARGHTVRIASARQTYHRPARTRVGRYLREGMGLIRLLVRGLRGPRPDVILSLTSPPCLLLPATLLARWRRAAHVHWVMDLYPEIALALGEIRDGPASRALRQLMGGCYRRAAAVLALDADMAERLRAHGVECSIVRPWPPEPCIGGMEQTSENTEWLYSGNLGRAHEWQTLLDAQAELERRGVDATLVFQGGGSSREQARRAAEAMGLRRVLWRGYVPEQELEATLLRAGVLIVTQRPETRGLLWPSKLGLVLRLPRPVLWIGPTEGAIATELAAMSATGIFPPGDAGGVADWVEAALRRPPENCSRPVCEAKSDALELLARQLLSARGDGS